MSNQASDATHEPIEVKLIAAASDGTVRVTPKKCENIRKLLTAFESAAETRGFERGRDAAAAIIRPQIAKDTDPVALERLIKALSPAQAAPQWDKCSTCGREFPPDGLVEHLRRGCKPEPDAVEHYPGGCGVGAPSNEEIADMQKDAVEQARRRLRNFDRLFDTYTLGAALDTVYCGDKANLRADLRLLCAALDREEASGA